MSHTVPASSASIIAHLSCASLRIFIITMALGLDALLWRLKQLRAPKDGWCFKTRFQHPEYHVGRDRITAILECDFNLCLPLPTLSQFVASCHMYLTSCRSLWSVYVGISSVALHTQTVTLEDRIFHSPSNHTDIYVCDVASCFIQECSRHRTGYRRS